MAIHFAIPREFPDYWELRPACSKRMGKNDALEFSPLKVTCESCKQDARFITALKILSAKQDNN